MRRSLSKPGTTRGPIIRKQSESSTARYASPERCAQQDLGRLRKWSIDRDIERSREQCRVGDLYTMPKCAVSAAVTRFEGPHQLLQLREEELSCQLQRVPGTKLPSTSGAARTRRTNRYLCAGIDQWLNTAIAVSMALKVPSTGKIDND